MLDNVLCRKMVQVFPGTMLRNYVIRMSTKEIVTSTLNWFMDVLVIDICDLLSKTCCFCKKYISYKNIWKCNGEMYACPKKLCTF